MNVRIFLILFQIKHMMAFIDQEANEKAEEIDAKVSNKKLLSYSAGLLKMMNRSLVGHERS